MHHENDQFLRYLRENIRFDSIKEGLLNISVQLRKYDGFSEISARFNTLLEKIYYAENIVKQYVKYERTQVEGYTYNSDVDTSHMKFTPVEFDKLKPFQKLVLLLFDAFDEEKLRILDECLYKEISNTHAWKKICTVQEFIHQKCSMVYNFENWILITTNKDMDVQLVNYFSKCYDHRLPRLKKNRHKFSFSNGIYFSKYTTDSEDDLMDKFIEYGSDDHNVLDHSEASCKYFAKEFRYYNENIPENIMTPCLDSIYIYQGLSCEVIKINKMFLGRMLYDVGELDNWQVIQMLLGSGGTGKSTIHNIVRMFYDHDDVGIMSNNYQKIFGLCDIYDKFAFIAPEIKRDWGIDQAEFQEIVSGGKLNVNIKHKPSLTVQWKTPGMLAGNENPGFVDNSSSIQRRVVVTRFDKKVINVDPSLSVKLEEEIDSIMKQCNLYYLTAVRRYRNNDIWTWIPRYFLETQTMMACASNALIAFLDSDILSYGEEHYIPMDEFFKRFNYFCTENNYRKPNINVDMYSSPFARYNIVIDNKVNKQYMGRMYTNTTFLMGVNFSQQCES
jgi:hypothetical protein